MGTYLFVVNVINKGGYQILIGAATGAIGYIFLKVLKTLNKNPPDKEAEQSST